MPTTESMSAVARLLEDCRAYAAASPDRLASEAFVRMHETVVATHRGTGVRSVFVTVDHIAVGPGFFMRDLRGGISGPISDADLADLRPFSAGPSA